MTALTLMIDFPNGGLTARRADCLRQVGAFPSWRWMKCMKWLYQRLPAGLFPDPPSQSCPEQVLRREDEAGANTEQASWGISRLLLSPERCLKGLQQSNSNSAPSALLYRDDSSISKSVVSGIYCSFSLHSIESLNPSIFILFSNFLASSLSLRVFSWSKVECIEYWPLLETQCYVFLHLQYSKPLIVWAWTMWISS